MSTTPRSTALRIQEYCRSALASRSSKASDVLEGTKAATSVVLQSDELHCQHAATALLRVMSAINLGFRRRADAAAAADHVGGHTDGTTVDTDGTGDRTDTSGDVAKDAPVVYQAALQVCCFLRGVLSHSGKITSLP